MRRATDPLIVLRCALGGVLMGLANLVPGVSGGTMLLATGVYRRFVDAVARVTTFRWSVESLLPLTVIVAAAIIAIVGCAGIITDLVTHHRWIMFSVFLGLTLGGVPLLWRLISPIGPSGLVGCAVGLLIMVGLAALQWSGSGGLTSGGWLMLGLAGLAAGAAMVLPGLSGSFILLILGQYLVITSAVDQARAAVSGDGDLSEPLAVIIPVGIGAVIGVVGISNGVRWLLEHRRQATLGLLLGLLAGAVLGLWPFRSPREPHVGEEVRGRVVTQAMLDADDIATSQWPTETFAPTWGQIASSLALIAAGFACSIGITLLGDDGDEGEPDAAPSGHETVTG